MILSDRTIREELDAGDAGFAVLAAVTLLALAAAALLSAETVSRPGSVSGGSG